MTKQANTEFSPLESGEYLVRMNRITPTKTKTGVDMLKVGYQVIKKVGDTDENESKSKNRLIFENILVGHPSETVKEIVEDRIDRYLKAVGESNGLKGIGHDLSKLSDFLDLPFKAKVGIQEGTNGYSDSNKITSFAKR